MFQLVLAAGALVLIAIVVLLNRLAGAPGTARRVVGGDAPPPRVTLADIGPQHEARLRKITSQKETMKDAGDGRPWSDKKVKNFIRYSLEEQGQGEDRENFYWGVLVGGSLVGVVGIHPVSYGKPETAGLNFVTIYLDSAHVGRGVGSAALREALARHRAARGTPVYADVRVGNAASLALLGKLGFVETGRHKIRGEPYVRLKAPQAGCPARKSPEKIEKLLSLGPNWKYTKRFPKDADTLPGKIYYSKRHIRQKTHMDDATGPAPPGVELPGGFNVYAPPAGAVREIPGAIGDLEELFAHPEDVRHCFVRNKKGVNIDYLFMKKDPKDPDPTYGEMRAGLEARSPRFASLVAAYANEIADLYGIPREDFGDHSSISVGRYPVGEGLWLHIDNVGHHPMIPVITVSLGTNVVYDLAPTFVSKKYPEGPLRVTMGEGDLVVLDGEARLEWSHAVPYGREEVKYTLFFYLRGVASRVVGRSGALKADILETPRCDSPDWPGHVTFKTEAAGGAPRVRG
jgi:RimJ/RimL family protein N-acetyltransferase/alkylated DNA repair dioxygenase AlkB